MRIRLRNQAGDTIVEVMVVLAILGLAIGISYATANRSLLNTRAAQENNQATAILQAQIEAFRYWYADPAFSAALSTQTTFCLNTASSDSSTVIMTGASCNFDTNSIASTSTTANYLYTVAVAKSTALNAPTNEYTFTATWPDVSGDGTTDSVTLVYRAYQS